MSEIRAEEVKGTPKSLHEAIANGIHETTSLDDAPMVIERHVRDFLAQKFQVALFRHEFAAKALEELFRSIEKGTL